MFDPGATWAHLSQFEHDLAEYFQGLGYEANIIKSIGGQPGERILYITPVANSTKGLAQNTSKAPTNKSPKEALDRLKDPKTYKNK